MTKYNKGKNSRNIRFLEMANDTALGLVESMKDAYHLDIRSIESKKIAYHRVKLLTILGDKLKNLYIRRLFIENHGLKEIYIWLLPVLDQFDEER